MTGDGTDALEQALALHATPGLLSVLLERPLPRAVLLLIRIAADDSEAIANATARSLASRQVVVDAAVLFIQQVMFHESADSYRLLGVHSDDELETIKEHYRWLMRWLHPDRHPERWVVVYSERVNRAWRSLNSEQRRREYDALPSALAHPASSYQRHRVKSFHPTPASPVLLSARTVRRLPALVLGSLATVSMISLIAFYWVQRDRPVVIDVSSGAHPSQDDVDENSAQEEAIKRRIAFEEHVIELSQPIPPAAPKSASPPVSNGIQAGAAQAVAKDFRPVGGNPEGASSMAAVPPRTSVPAQRSVAVPEIAIAIPPQGGAPSSPPVIRQGLQEPNRPADAKGVSNIDAKPGPATDHAMPRSSAQSVPDVEVVATKASPGATGAGVSRSDQRSVAGGNASMSHAIHGIEDEALKKPVPGIKSVPPSLAVASASPVPPHAAQPPEPLPALPVRTTAVVVAPAVARAETLPAPAKITEAGTSRREQETAVATQSGDTTPGRMSPQEAAAVVPREFEEAYARGDLKTMMRLFAADAMENRDGIDAIQVDYNHLFHDSSTRELRLDSLKWVVAPDRIVGSGPFEALIRKNDEQVIKTVRGWIQIEAVPVGGIWKIQRLMHRNAE